MLPVNREGKGSMKTTKKKPFIPLIVLGAFLAAYLGYLVGGAWAPGRRLDEFMAVFSYIWKYPFGNYFNENTIKCVVTMIFVYGLIVVMYYSSQRNLMPGREFGTARFADVGMVNKTLKDPDENYNRVLSQNVKMSLNTRHTKLNNNVLIIGGAGSGKTFFEVKPNLMQMPRNNSFVITDPKGEILRSTGSMLIKNGYNVKVINLLEMDKSDCYNPFAYLREETDVVKLITNLIKNTTPKGSNSSDPFWEKAESLFLQSIFYYVWMEVSPDKRNFETVLKLIGEAKVSEKGEPSRLDFRMKFLEETSPLGENHPAVKQYNKCMRGAGDTIRSIIISANARLAFLENKQVLRMLSKDDMNLAELGIGVNGDGNTRTALFCVIPDSDKSYNFIIGMLYTQIFQELYHQADFNCGGRLPIHVTFMLDEFANVALPDDFCSLLSTMRSREISCVIIIQNLAQIKALFKDTWETIPGNCDALIYLGGNEVSTHKYISELLGKATIDKKTNGETRGRQGSSSRNYDVIGRDLLTPDEARKFDNKKCLIFIRGFDPIEDQKFNPFGHKAFSQIEDGGAEPYIHAPGGGIPDKGCEILSEKSFKYYKKLADKGENVFIDSIKYEDFEVLTELEMGRRFTEIGLNKTMKEVESSLEFVDPQVEREVVIDMDEAFGDRAEDDDATDVSSGETSGNTSDASDAGKSVKKNEYADELIEMLSHAKISPESIPGSGKSFAHRSFDISLSGEHPPLNGEDSIMTRMTSWKYTEEQIEELHRAYRLKMPMEEIMKFFYPDMPVKDMKRIINGYEKYVSGRG